MRTSRRRNGQALVEFALVAPIMLVLGLGAVALDSFVQAKSQLDHAVSRAALYAARDPYDPCLPGDEPSEPGGFSDVSNTFTSALTSPLFAGSPPTLTVTCTTQTAPTTTCVTVGGVTQAGCQTGVSAWFGANLPSDSGSCVSTSQPYDQGCFVMWRGAIIAIDAKVSLRVAWAPFWNNVTLGSSAAQQIEPYRVHTCPASVPSEAC